MHSCQQHYTSFLLLLQGKYHSSINKEFDLGTETGESAFLNPLEILFFLFLWLLHEPIYCIGDSREDFRNSWAYSS